MANVINETTIHQIAALEHAEACFASLNRRIETVQKEKKEAQKEEKEASLISNSTNHPSKNSVVAAQISLQRLYDLRDTLVYRFPALLEA